MVNCHPDLDRTRLDQVFTALSDATRRDVLAQLERSAERGDAAGCSIGELAEPHGMSLPGFMKHLAVLQAAGLIERAKTGRVVRCRLDAAPMQAAAAWMSRYERFWTDRFDELDRFLHPPEEPKPCPPSNPKSPRRSASTVTTASPRTRSGAPGPSRKR